MLTRTLGLLVAVATCLLGAVLVPGIAAAEPPVQCSKSNPRTGACLLWASTPSNGGAADDAGAGGGTGTAASAGGSSGNASANPCTYTPAQPQSAPTSALWQGMSPADGVMYVKVCPRVDGSGLTALLEF